MSLTRISTILDYWFADLNLTPSYFDERLRLWFEKSKDTDAYIKKNFEKDVEAAARGELSSWEETPEGLLALIILLDQFSLNLYRGQDKAYLQSQMAIRLSEKMIETGWVETLTPGEKLFVYLPFEHSEDMKYQRRSVELFRTMAEEAPLNLKNELDFFVDFAERHFRVVEKFGRFPNRNAAFSRESTPEEEEFLASPAAPY